MNKPWPFKGLRNINKIRIRVEVIAISDFKRKLTIIAILKFTGECKTY